MSFGYVLSRLKIKLCAVTLCRGPSAAVRDSGMLATAIFRGPSAALADRSTLTAAGLIPDPVS